MSAAYGTEPELGTFVDLLGAQTGLFLPSARRRDITTHARKLMTQLSIPDPSMLLPRPKAEASLLDELIAESTVGETFFSRSKEFCVNSRKERSGDAEAARIAPDLTGWRSSKREKVSASCSRMW